MMILVRNPIGRTHTEHMRAQTFARLNALVTVASIVAGCSAANGDGGSPTPPLQLRLVRSSAEGPCSAPPPTSDGPFGCSGQTQTQTSFEMGSPASDVAWSLVRRFLPSISRSGSRRSSQRGSHHAR